MIPVPGNPNKCQFQWLLDTDLKGWIPQYIIDAALSGAQFEYIENIRKFAEKLHENGRVASFLTQQESICGSLNSTVAIN